MPGRSTAAVRRCDATTKADEGAKLITPDGRYFVVRGRLWRCTNPNLDDAARSRLTGELMDARRRIGRIKRKGEGDLAAARASVDRAKVALGERGPVWWTDGEPDYNRETRPTRAGTRASEMNEGGVLVGKRVQFDDKTFALINLLRRERSRSFQQLAEPRRRSVAWCRPWQATMILAMNPDLTVYHDGSCPVSRLEIGHFRQQPGAERIRFVDVSSPSVELDPLRRGLGDNHGADSNRRVRATSISIVHLGRLDRSAYHEF